MKDHTKGYGTWSATFKIDLTKLMKEACPFEVVGGKPKSRAIAQAVLNETWMNPVVSSILACRSLTGDKGPLTEIEIAELEREFGEKKMD